MKTIYKLFIISLFTLNVFPSCGDENKKDVEITDPVGGNISPVASFSVESTSNENELLVKWTNSNNQDLDMVEISYKEVAVNVSDRAFTPGHVLLPAQSGKKDEYLLKVPYFATYDVAIVAINKAGKRSVAKSRTMAPYHKNEDEPGIKFPAMLDREHSYMTSVIALYFGKS